MFDKFLFWIDSHSKRLLFEIQTHIQINKKNSRKIHKIFSFILNFTDARSSHKNMFT